MVTTPMLDWPGMRSEYAWLPPYEGATVTGPGQIGVAFTGHRGLVRSSDGVTHEGDVPAGSTVVSGGHPITWTRVREPTEALEIYPDPGLVMATAAGCGVTRVDVRPRIGVPDGTVLGIASVLRQAHVTGGGLTDVAASTLAHRLIGHLLRRYADVPAADAGPGKLAPAAVDRVFEVVEAGLHATLTLDDLAAVARLSPFHFSRAFRAATGMAPYAFVTARRMDRARRLLTTSGCTVDEAATRVAYANLSHFRRTFRRHHGVPPSALRRTQQEST